MDEWQIFSLNLWTPNQTYLDQYSLQHSPVWLIVLQRVVLHRGLLAFGTFKLRSWVAQWCIAMQCTSIKAEDSLWHSSPFFSCFFFIKKNIKIGKQPDILISFSSFFDQKTLKQETSPAFYFFLFLFDKKKTVKQALKRTLKSFSSGPNFESRS